MQNRREVKVCDNPSMTTSSQCNCNEVYLDKFIISALLIDEWTFGIYDPLNVNVPKC